MNKLTSEQRQIIKRCQGSILFFISQFCWCKHPKLGEIKFKLFDYQRDALLRFKASRFLIFWKTRQAGLSTVCGAYALWYAMFGCAKTVLVVSKRDDDAKEFLDKNVKFVYDHLPDWMRAIWPKAIDNEHKIGFPNGSKITSLSSSPDTLRSNSASLVILDETAHMPHIDKMWTAGASTLMHAGQCLCLGTPNGIGNWYWQTVTDAEEKQNDFDLIKIDWHQMTWKLEHVDPVTGIKSVIAPTSGIRETQTQDEKRKYGKYWSPWLEEQYRLLTERGDDRKFRQEVLALFLGSGNTVLSTEALNSVQAQHVSEHLEVGDVDYVNPTIEERCRLSFDRKLWIWEKPVRGTKVPQASLLRGQIKLVPQPNLPPQEEPHLYVAGVDTAAGDGSDFGAIVVWDIMARRQVAELKMKVGPSILAKMADYIGRYYNDALLVVESTGIGKATVQELEDLCYPNLWRPRKENGKFGAFGYKMSVSSKPLLNKTLIDHIGDTEGGEDRFTVMSFRLFKELCIYVHLSGGRTGCEPGVGNNDDLVVAAGLGLMGINDVASSNSSVLAPYRTQVDDPKGELAMTNKDMADGQKKILEMSTRGGPGATIPLLPIQDSMMPSAQDELTKFTQQIGGIPLAQGRPAVIARRHEIRR
jgi:hypothetical protein